MSTLPASGKVHDMRYVVEVEINKPIDEVVALFDNPANMDRWMDGLQSFEHISGTPGQPGAKSRLTFKMGNRAIVMVETIVTRNLPDEFSGVYEAPGVYNPITNRFAKITESKTRYITEQEFQFKGFMKIIGFLMPGSFKKQTRKFMEDFKRFAESV